MKAQDRKIPTHKEIAWKQTNREIGRVTDKLGMPVDKEIRETVIVMRLLGFNTTASCAGHLIRTTGGPYVMFESPKAHKYASVARAIDDKRSPELRKARKKANYFRALDLQLLSGYIADFYNDHPVHYGSHLIVQSMPLSLNVLKCHDAEVALVAKQTDKKKMLECNRQEFSEFTEYLKSIL